MPNPDVPTNNPGKPIASGSPATSELSVIKLGDPIGYPRGIHRRSKQNLTVPQTNEDPNKPEKKPKPTPIFTEIPIELDATFLKIMFQAGLRNANLFLIREGKDPLLVAGAQNRQNKFRTIIEEIRNSRGDSKKILELYTSAISEIHPSTNPEKRKQDHQLNPQQMTLVLKDPIGFIAIDIMRYAESMGVPIPPMKFRIVERLTQLRDEFDTAIALPNRRNLMGPSRPKK